MSIALVRLIKPPSSRLLVINLLIRLWFKLMAAATNREPQAWLGNTAVLGFYQHPRYSHRLFALIVPQTNPGRRCCFIYVDLAIFHYQGGQRSPGGSSRNEYSPEIVCCFMSVFPLAISGSQSGGASADAAANKRTRWSDKNTPAPLSAMIAGLPRSDWFVS